MNLSDQTTERLEHDAENGKIVNGETIKDDHPRYGKANPWALVDYFFDLTRQNRTPDQISCDENNAKLMANTDIVEKLKTDLKLL